MHPVCTIFYKLQLNNICQRDIMVTDYTPKIKEIYDVLGSINMTMDEDEMF